MYNPPISIVEQAMESFHAQVENNVMSVVKSYGINVDKYELIAALNHDRMQYEKGYADGVREVDKIATILAELFDCPCNFSPTDEWLPYVCDYRDDCKCSGEECWKQFFKHYDEKEMAGASE